MKNTIPHEAGRILKKHFNICGFYNLNGYMSKMPKLYQDLKANAKDQYQHNDRIVFQLADHDFYLNNQGPGWTLYNLQLILTDLNISNYFCLLITHQPNYNDYTRQVQQLTTDDHFIDSVTTTLAAPELFTSENLPGDFRDKIAKPFCVLSRQSRPHRTYFMSKLFEKNLQNFGLIAYNNIPFKTHKPHNETAEDFDTGRLGLLTIPQSWQRILLKRTHNQQIYNNFVAQYQSYKNFNEEFDINNKHNSCQYHATSPISNALIYVGLETEPTLDKVFISPISLRGIVYRRPFLILGVPGTLNYLKTLGFKTFGDFWDESYDLTTDIESRVDHLINILHDWSTLSNKALTEQYQAMASILDHNYNHFFTTLPKIAAEQFDKECLRNLTRY